MSEYGFFLKGAKEVKYGYSEGRAEIILEAKASKNVESPESVTPYLSLFNTNGVWIIMA